MHFTAKIAHGLAVLGATSALAGCGGTAANGTDGAMDAPHDRADTSVPDVPVTGLDVTDAPSPGLDALSTDSGDGATHDARADVPADAHTDAHTDAHGDGAVPAMPSAGCASGAGLPEGAATITVGTLTRNYVLRLPAGYTRAHPWPLVFALHPNGSNPSYWDATTGTRDIRTVVHSHAVLVLGQARMGDWRGDLPADLAYFDALVTRLKSQLCIDTARMFSMGFSGGGSFSGVLGCRRADIRAIATGGAVEYFTPADCVGEPAAWITIGAMEMVPERVTFRDFWRTRNACTTTTASVPPPPCVAYAGCAAGRPTQYCQHTGGHEWPSFGTDAAWAFFSQF